MQHEQPEYDADHHQDPTDDMDETPIYIKSSIASRYLAINCDILLVSLLTLLFYYFIVTILFMPEHSSQLSRTIFLGFYSIFITYFTILPLFKTQATIGSWITRSAIGNKDNYEKMEVERSFFRAHLSLIFLTPMLIIYYICFYHSFIDTTIVQKEIPELQDLSPPLLLGSFIMVGQFILLMFYGSILIITWSLNALFPKFDYTESPQDYLCKTIIFRRTT